MSELLEIVKEKLQTKFGDAVLASEMHYDFPVFILKKEITHDALKFLKEDKDVNFHFLTTMCGLHHPEQSVDKEFGLMYQLHNMPKNYRIRIKTFMPREDLGYANCYGYLEKQQVGWNAVNLISSDLILSDIRI